MKLLITGICGFAGSTLARHLIESDSSLIVYGIDNFIRQGSELNRDKLLKIGVKLFHGDIRTQSDIDMLPEVNWVIDAAANPSVLAGADGKSSSRQLIEHNLYGTVNILEFCKRYHAGFILLSTNRVYSIKPLTELNVTQHGRSFCLNKEAINCPGLTTLGITEEFGTTPPLSLYGSSKLASETLAIEYGELFDFPVWINRCGVLAGAGQFGRADQGIFSYWINSYLRKRDLTYIGFGGNGYQVRDALHPGDLISLLLKQISSDNSVSAPKVINLGGGMQNAMSLAQLSDWCETKFGKHFVKSDPKSRMFDIPWMVMDYSQAQRVWGWKPQTPLNDILNEIAKHAELNPDWLKISGAEL